MAVIIIFDNPSPVFFAGQTITGRVQVSCKKPTETRGISLNFWGFSRVHWTERRTTHSGTGNRRRTNHETIHYNSIEEYYANNFLLRGNGSTVEVLPPGDHIFNFSYVLPDQIPSSFESYIGQVRHQCKATMIIPMGFNKTCHRPYSVNTLYDLNLDPMSKAPISAETFKTLCCLCCKSGPISLVLRIDRSGFVPGEKLYINAECSNQSNRIVNRSKVKIFQVITFNVRGRTRQLSNTIAKMEHGEIPPGESDTWSNDGLLIPPIPPSHLMFCQHIDIQYFLEFSVEPSGPAIDLKVLSPVVIGSIPLQQTFNMFAPSPTSPTAPGLQNADFSTTSPISPTAPGFQNAGFDTGADQPPAYSAVADAPPSSSPGLGFTFPGMSQYPDMPPPSYGESMASAPMEINWDNAEHDNSAFNPQYVSYNFKNN